MESSMVIFLECLALGSVILAVVLGFGKKYHNEEIQKEIDKAVDGRIEVTQKALQKKLKEYLDRLKNSEIQNIAILDEKKEVVAIIIPINLYETMCERIDNYESKKVL